MSEKYNTIIEAILNAHPRCEAIYLFCSHGTDYETPDSDIDIAVLLSVLESKKIPGPHLHDKCKCAIEDMTGKDIHLINLRQANTVFQNEIIFTGRVIYLKDLLVLENFEAIVMSLYQKLNEERAHIIQDIIKTKKVLAA